MADIVLTTLNARYAHTSLALRYLAANLGELRPRAQIRELTIHDRPVDAAEHVLEGNPSIVGIGVYIWNARESLELVRILKAVRPDVTVVLGGPEVSHETSMQDIVRVADYTIAGEGDLAFARLCRSLLVEKVRPRAPVIHAPAPDIAALALPYEEYTDADIRDRNIYVEASRGCPFRCEFCLSSLDQAVRQFPQGPFLASMARLIDRGARHFKFIDRTFNLSVRTASEILEFFLERIELDLFLHFEMVPDRLPTGLRDIIAKFPRGSLQFEVGIQTFDPDVADRISRRQDLAKLEDNLRYLRQDTGVHIHSDLIVGLPGEDLETFAQGFDRLVELAPQEIQVGILKRLRGTPISRHDDEWGMVYSTSPPYEILATSQVSFEQMQDMKRFARVWDLVCNSGNFRDSAPLIWRGLAPFSGFRSFVGWLVQRIGTFKGIALDRLTKLTFDYLTLERGFEEAEVARALAGDFARPGRRLPAFLAKLTPQPTASSASLPAATPKRQARHL